MATNDGVCVRRHNDGITTTRTVRGLSRGAIPAFGGHSGSSISSASVVVAAAIHPAQSTKKDALIYYARHPTNADDKWLCSYVHIHSVSVQSGTRGLMPVGSPLSGLCLRVSLSPCLSLAPGRPSARLSRSPCSFVRASVSAYLLPKSA